MRSLENWDSSRHTREEYLEMVLLFIKLPQKYSQVWLVCATNDVMELFQIKFECSSEKNCVFTIAQVQLNDAHNLKMRRKMYQHARFVWYDRMPKAKGLATISGKGVETKYERTSIWVDCRLLRGCIVEATGRWKVGSLVSCVPYPPFDSEHQPSFDCYMSP
jgi:hypothetical protein